jgi:hypothetical protein
MEAVRTSKTSVYFNETTRRYIPESCRLHTHRRETLKSHTNNFNILRQGLRRSGFATGTVRNGTQGAADDSNYNCIKVRFQVLTTASTKPALFWDVSPCS